ncbi:hypothetical protein H2198_007967 [Neophaeococcomyces mojaviensis]|uniref:Uncharacterized protein n=1 Tax=Neophaeococcomyces mojaviensis TaxID=3383035 RepID=A0ACC2ZYW0_9EURO|nr:hypothetical protein H2198_007967 [Knufia sp. JES_112]
MAFKAVFEPVSQRPRSQDAKKTKLQGLFHILRINISIGTWLLVGATLQALAVYLFSNGHYVLLISTMLLLARIGKTVLQAKGVLANPYLQDVIPYRTTALIPDESTGEFTESSSKKIAILHLGAKANHPFGYFAPQFKAVGDWIGIMNKEMDDGKVKGFLGQTTFHRLDERGAPEIILISYWESIEDLWAFAHSGTHREVWQWWEKTIKENGYVGINHEIFQADVKNWENIYVNFQPTLMGATTFLKKGGKTLEGGVVPDEWISPLVDAKRGKLAKSSGRMGREVSTFDATRVGKETYDA